MGDVSQFLVCLADFRMINVVVISCIGSFGASFYSDGGKCLCIRCRSCGLFGSGWWAGCLSGCLRLIGETPRQHDDRQRCAIAAHDFNIPFKSFCENLTQIRMIRIYICSEIWKCLVDLIGDQSLYFPFVLKGKKVKVAFPQISRLVTII